MSRTSSTPTKSSWPSWATAWKKSSARIPASSNQGCTTKEGRILHPFWLTITAIKNEQQETTLCIGIYTF
ncbi:MAG: hypothetical protein WCZ98_05440 [Sideroxydans sp.]